jgi:hypothetical protein
VHRVGLVGGRANLRAAAHEGVARDARRIEVAALTRHPAPNADVGRVVRLERQDLLWLREAGAAIGRRVVGDCVGGRVAPDIRELAVGHGHVPIAGHGDIRELDVVHRLAQLHRARERSSVVGRADEVDARVETV